MHIEVWATLAYSYASEFLASNTLQLGGHPWAHQVSVN